MFNSRLVAEQEDTGLLLGHTVDGELVENIEDDLSHVKPFVTRLTALSLARRYHRHRGMHIDNVSILQQL